MKLSRYMLVRATSDAGAASLPEESEGFSPEDCSTFTANPRLINVGEESQIWDIDKEFTVINASGEEVKEGDLLAVHQDISGFWVYGERSYPAWEIEGTLKDVLYANDETGTAEFVKIRSVAPHSRDPLGVDEETEEVEFHNPWAKDGLCNSPVILQYIPGDPEGRWEIRKAALYKARQIKFRFPSEELLSHWGGQDPESCGEYLNIQYPLGQPCVPCDMLAFYDPFTDSYQAYASPSAVLGEAETMNIVQAMSFDGCGINYIRQPAKVFPCGSEPSLIQIAPDLLSVEVLTRADTQTTQEDCGSGCLYSWDGSFWQLTEACPDANCTCGPPPEQPPGEWNGGAETWGADCTKTKVTGLQFNKAIIQVCAFMTTSADIIPVSEDCPDDEGGY